MNAEAINSFIIFQSSSFTQKKKVQLNDTSVNGEKRQKATENDQKLQKAVN
jgi:hypothetical protein